MPVIHISNGTIVDISSDRGNTLVTVTYRGNLQSGRGFEEEIGFQEESGVGRGFGGNQNPGGGRPGGPQDNRRREQTVRLIVSRRTVILDRNGRPVPASALRIGMIINAAISPAMTRSIPPQSNAFLIEIVREPVSENTTTGTVIEIDRRGRNFSTISDRDFSSIIRFNITDNTRFLDRFRRPMNFSELRQGMRVRVRHANFMTASIPPQTTAFEVRVL